MNFYAIASGIFSYVFFGLILYADYYGDIQDMIFYSAAFLFARVEYKFATLAKGPDQK